MNHMTRLMQSGGVLLLLIAASAMAQQAAPTSLPMPALTAAPTPDADGDFVIGKPYTPAPELTVKEGVPKGKLHEFIMESTDSKIYPGLPPRGRRGAPPPTQPGEIVPYHRAVAVYVPAQYVPGTPAPFIVVQDGASPKYHDSLPKILDNMIHEKRLPVMIAVLVNHGGGDGPGSERGLEYDTVSDRYTKFIESEVLPKISKDYNITFTTDPEGRATMGGSSGAACAFTMGWFHPELYRRILSYSGTFVNQQSPANPASPHGAWEYHENLIPKSDAKPLRIWMQVGQNDNGSNSSEESFHNWVLANNHMASVLKAKGYHYQYVYSQGAGHVDPAVVAQTLPEALLYVWKGYPIK